MTHYGDWLCYNRIFFNKNIYITRMSILNVQKKIRLGPIKNSINYVHLHFSKFIASLWY